MSKYLIYVFFCDYLNDRREFLGTIPTNIEMKLPKECLMRAREEFGPLVRDANCIYAYQQPMKVRREL